MSFAKVSLIGNVGRAPELRQTPQGVAVCKFSVAVSPRREEDKPLWFTVTCWRRLAEVAAEYLTVGRQVFIEGRITLDEWVDREGKNRTTLAVEADELQFIGRVENERAAQPTPKPQAEPDEDPFPFTPVAEPPAQRTPANRPVTRPATNQRVLARR